VPHRNGNPTISLHKPIGIAIAVATISRKFKRFLVHSRTVHARVFAKATREP
jgi:hypothetical protein